MTARSLARRALALLLVLAPSRTGAQGQPDGGADSDGRFQSVVYPRPAPEPGQALVVTGREMAERGARNLAEALDLLPALSLRPSGRGATRVDFRGARQTSVLILIDGVPVNEPYFGDFDLASIPVTDIVSVRVSLQPASPLDGPGGDGGVVEVETRRASGPRRLDVRVQGETTPGMQATVSGRTPIAERWALRLSGGGGDSITDYAVTSAAGDRADFANRRSQGQAALRLEYRAPALRLTADGFYQHRRYAAAPNETTAAVITDVPSEDALRFVLGADAEVRGLRLAVGGYGGLLFRTTDLYRGGTLADPIGHEEARAYRLGAAAQAERALGSLLRFSLRLSLDSEGATVLSSLGPPAAGRQTYAQLALGGRFHWRWLRIDVAAGLGAALASLAAPWPEAKVSITAIPNRFFQLQVSGARKGRPPTLRDRFDPAQGEPSLRPEQTTYLGVEVMTRPSELVEARVAGWARLGDGLIRFDPDTNRFGNLDEIRVAGLDVSLEVARGRLLGGGVAYLFGDAWSPTSGLDPLFNFPRHRMDVWLSSTWKRAGATARLRYLGSRIDNNQPLPAYVLVDLSVFARLHANLFASARVENLLDAHYALRAGIAGAPRTLSLLLQGTWD